MAVTKNLDDEIKYGSISPDVKFKEISWTKQKTRPDAPESTMSDMGKRFAKKADQKIKNRNQC